VNLDPSQPYEVQRGDRIAQLVLQRVGEASFTPVDVLPDSERGLGGFGSTGT
jgi:dUTP pyrophosphatase